MNPAHDLNGFQGSRLWPKLDPTTAAKPSPTHQQSLFYDTSEIF